MMINGLHDRVTVESKAVYSKTTRLDFKIYDSYLGSSSLFASAEAASAFHDTLTTIGVEAISLDDYKPVGSRVDFIKIDAEGAEPFILRGASRVLSENPHVQIMMEFAPSIISASFGSVDTFLNYIDALGFAIWRIDHDSQLVASSQEDLLHAPHCDVLLRRS